MKDSVKAIQIINERDWKPDTKAISIFWHDEVKIYDLGASNELPREGSMKYRDT